MPRAAAGLTTSPKRRRPPMPSDRKRDYAVVYGKPPRHTRFTGGQSGNPRGRARGAKNLKTLLIDTLNELVIVAPTRPAIPRCIKPRKETSGTSGMKAHIGVDSRSKLIHAVVATPANVADSTVLPDLLHGN